MSADSIFHLKEEIPSFELWLHQGEELWLAGRGLFGFLRDLGRQVEQAAKDGKRFRLLLTNPDYSFLIKAIAASNYRTSDPVKVEEHTRESIDSLKNILKETPNGSIEVRLAGYIPPNRYWIIDGQKPNGRMIIEMFGYKISRNERTHIILDRKKDISTFTFHLEQFERIWQDAERLE